MRSGRNKAPSRTLEVQEPGDLSCRLITGPRRGIWIVLIMQDVASDREHFFLRRRSELYIINGRENNCNLSDKQHYCLARQIVDVSMYRVALARRENNGGGQKLAKLPIVPIRKDERMHGGRSGWGGGGGGVLGWR